MTSEIERDRIIFRMCFGTFTEPLVELRGRTFTIKAPKRTKLREAREYIVAYANGKDLPPDITVAES